MRPLAIALTFTLLPFSASTAQEGPDPDRPGAKEEINYHVPDEIEIDYDRLDSIDTSGSPIGVVPLPDDVGATLTGLFSKYTKHLAPNGKPIHILGQSRVTDLQMARAREILKYILTDAPGTKYGSDKTELANRMGDVRATLIYTDTQARAFAMYDILEPSDLRLQDLYGTESPVEGDHIYVHNAPPEGDFFTRDASYEEIMHLVHAKAIEDVLPEYHEAIVEAEKRAVEAGIYNYGDWAPHEYIITGFDIYYGLWDHDPQGDGTSFGDEYPYHTRAELEEHDKPLYDLVEEFFLPYLTYEAFVHPDFEGTFTIERDEEIEYTLKSRYLVNVTLTGDKDTGIRGNDQDNRLRGNAGDNRIDGAEGTDTAVFSGDAAEYRIETTAGTTLVTDTVAGRDGVDELISIEALVFRDKTVDN